MGMYIRNLERGLYDRRCAELKEHFKEVLKSDKVRVEYELKRYTRERIVFYNVYDNGEFVISERFNRLMRMQDYHKKRNARYKLLETNKLKRFEEIRKRYEENGIVDVRLDLSTRNGAITYICPVCGHEGHTNMSSAYASKCRCKMCFLKNKRK